MRISLSVFDDRHKVESALVEDELEEIGRATCNWAILEHAVFKASHHIAEALSIPPPPDVTNLSFKRRLKAFRALVLLIAEPLRTKMTSVAHDIANAEQRRHRITHGLWDWDRKSAAKMEASSFRDGVEFEETFDLKKLTALADTIAELNFRVLFPSGKTEAWREMIEAAATFPSRDRRVQLQERLESRHQPQPKPEGAEKPPPRGKG